MASGFEKKGPWEEELLKVVKNSEASQLLRKFSDR